MDPQPAVPTTEVNIVPISTEPKELAFHFKKEKIRDNEGKVIGEGKKLPSIKANLPVPNVAGVLEIVQAQGKELELLLDSMTEVIYTQARGLVNDIREANTKAGTPDNEIKAEEIDVAKLSWSFIANMPKAERRGLGISEEDWEEFANDYRAIMPKTTGKDADRIEKHVQLFKNRFNRCRNDKKALTVLSDMLALWATNTANLEDNQEVYEYLNKRVETLLKEEEKVLAEAL